MNVEGGRVLMKGVELGGGGRRKREGEVGLSWVGRGTADMVMMKKKKKWEGREKRGGREYYIMNYRAHVIQNN